MLTLTTQDKINEKALYSAIKGRKITTARFRLPYTFVQTRTMLATFCRVEVESRGRQWNETPEYAKHIDTVAQWLTDPGDSTFGLFLCGDKGNGKTTLMKGLRSMYHYIYSDETPSKLETHPVKYGFEIVDAKTILRLAAAFSHPSKENIQERGRYSILRDVECLCVDDLGTEPRESMHYGDIITAVTDLMYYRYDRMLTTFATTNLAASEIADYYDERVADRFREMMKQVNFKHEKSFR